jgi:hypothetical protein
MEKSKCTTPQRHTTRNPSFNTTGLTPTTLRLGRRQKALNDLLDFIDVHTLQDARISGQTLSIEILNKLCSTFPARLECCLEKGGESITHDLCRLGEQDVMEDFGQGDSPYRAWSIDENRIICEQQFRVDHR